MLKKGMCMASHMWDYDIFHAWAFCSCPFQRFGQCEGLRCVERAKGKNPRILFLRAIKQLKSNRSGIWVLSDERLILICTTNTFFQAMSRSLAGCCGL